MKILLILLGFCLSFNPTISQCTTSNCVTLNGNNTINNGSGNYCIPNGSTWGGIFQNPNGTINLYIEAGGTFNASNNLGNFNSPNQLIINSCGTINFNNLNLNSSQYIININQGTLNTQNNINITNGELNIGASSTWNAANVKTQSNAKISIEGTLNTSNLEINNEHSESYFNIGNNSTVNISGQFYPHGIGMNNGIINTNTMITSTKSGTTIFSNTGEILVSNNNVEIRSANYLNNNGYYKAETFSIAAQGKFVGGNFEATAFSGIDQNNPCSSFTNQVTFCHPDGNTIPTVTLSNGNAFDPTICSGFGGFNVGCALGPLPITLLSFESRKVNSTHYNLFWQFSDALNFSHFELQQSEDASNWVTIETHFIRETVDGIFNSDEYQYSQEYKYYRLKMIDLDNTFEFSNILSVERNISTSINVFPNPIQSDLLFIENENTDKFILKIYSINGSLLSKSIEEGELRYTKDLSSLEIQNGIIVHIITNNDFKVFKLIK